MISRELCAAGLFPATASGTPARKEWPVDRIVRASQDKTRGCPLWRRKAIADGVWRKKMGLAWHLQGPTEMEPMQINNKILKGWPASLAICPAL